MKQITAYVNTTRIHWLVEELQKEGINDIMVSEYFRPDSQISKLEFLCNEDGIDEVKDIVHKIGTCGNSVDHLIEVKDYEGITNSIFPFI